MKIDVLGTEYEILEKTKEEDSFLEKCDGYCDKSIKTIVVSKREDDCELADFMWYRNKVVRHEIIHAFLNESGLSDSSTDSCHWAKNEEMVDFFAIQSPKIFAVFNELDIL